MNKINLDVMSNSNEFRVLEYVSELENLISSGVKIPLTSDKVIIKSDRIYELLDEIRDSLPNELKESVKITSAVKDLIQAAQEQSERIIKDAREYAEKLLDENEILLQAKKEADKMLSEAAAFKKASRDEVQNYMYQVFSATELGLNDIISQVKSAKDELLGTENGEKVVVNA